MKRPPRSVYRTERYCDECDQLTMHRQHCPEPWGCERCDAGYICRECEQRACDLDDEDRSLDREDR